MFGSIARLLLCLLPVAAWAQDTGLERLNTFDEGRGWEAVGRLDLQGTGFCTGALVAPDLVLTAAHCLFDRETGARIAPEEIEFLAGWRNGRASAYRFVRRAVVHPDYRYEGDITSERVSHDVALLELQRPIRNTVVKPFDTAARPRRGERVGVVSYARDRSEAPSLQQVCAVMARQEGVLILSCDVDFGASGAPVFSFVGDAPQIVSVVSAKAEVRGTRVALGSSLEDHMQVLQSELEAGRGFAVAPAPDQNRIVVGDERRDTGAKFLRSDGG